MTWSPPAASPLLLQVTRADVTRMLHADALRLGLGVLLIVAGLAAAAVYLRSLRGAESTLPWFGLFSFLYGLRLLARTDTFPLFFSAPPLFWRYVAAAITYVILIPGLLLLRAAFVLEAAAPDFPPGTVHLAVVDPGVGTDRLALGVAARF